MADVLQIDLHQWKATCHILRKQLQKVRIYICLKQELWFFKGKLRGINSVDRQVVYLLGIRPRTAMYIKSMQCHIVPDFVTKDFVTLHIKIGESGDWKEVVVRSAYFPLYSRAPPTELQIV